MTALHHPFVSIREDFENINRLKPVRLNTAGSSVKDSSRPDALPIDYVAVPTEAELEFHHSGLQLPSKSGNLQKLLTDLRKTGRFDYELCYLLRKQEALEELEHWVETVLKKRMAGDREFGKEADVMRFNRIAESFLRRAKKANRFKEALLQSLSVKTGNKSPSSQEGRGFR